MRKKELYLVCLAVFPFMICTELTIFGLTLAFFLSL